MASISPLQLVEMATCNPVCNQIQSKSKTTFFLSFTLGHDQNRIFEQHCIVDAKYVLGPKVEMWLVGGEKTAYFSRRFLLGDEKMLTHSTSRLSSTLNNTSLLTNSILERKSIGTTRKRQFTKCWWIIAQSLSITIGSRIWMATARHESHAVLT